MTKFELSVKTKLLKRGMTQTELAAKVSEKTGMKADRAYICNIIRGNRRSEAVKNAIKEILDIKD